MNQRKAKCIATKPYNTQWYRYQKLGNFIEKIDRRTDAAQINNNQPKPSPLGFQDLLF